MIWYACKVVGWENEGYLPFIEYEGECLYVLPKISGGGV